MTRVIHTGDTHLGYRQYHSPERRADFLTAFRRVIEDAIAEDVDAVVHAGDLFHDRSPSLVDVHGAIQVLRDLRDADIPFLAIVGNHERTREGQWVDLFETLGLATRLGEEPTLVGDVALYGLDFVPRSARADLEYEFAAHDAEFAALVAHGLFTPFNAEWNSKEVLSAASQEFDAMLLGDDHQPDTAQVGGTWVTYCGSTERTSSAERDERGYNLVDFDVEAVAEGRELGSGVSIRRRGIETRPFVAIDVELADGEGADRVRERIREEAIEDAVVVVSVEGAGDDVQPAQIEEFARERGALIARVRDRREIEAADGIEAVSFADPDAAVRERIRELGLSEVALAIDETVRSDVADSNVRDRVRERVEEMLDEPGAFEPGARHGEAGATGEGEAVDEAEGEGEGESEGETEGETSVGAQGDVGTGETAGAVGTDEGGEADAPEEDDVEAVPAADTDDESETTAEDAEVETVTEAVDRAAETDGTPDEANGDAETAERTAVDRDADDGGGETDGQLSMEDYL